MELPPPAATRLSSLHDGVISAILACLYTPEDIAKFARMRCPRWLPAHAMDFAFVCRSWHELINQVASAYALSRYTVSLPKPTRKSVVEIRRQLILRRAHTQQLHLERSPNADHMDGVILWRTIVSHAPHTTLLDLTTIHKKSRKNLTHFLLAAGSNLPRVHTLRLPQYKPDDPQKPWMQMMTNATMKALELWSTYGHRDGLRVLQASLSDYMSYFNSSVRMVETFAKYCPKLERLESNVGMGGICLEQWELDLKTWTRFCEACSSFTEFDWIRVPFATPFFEIFGQHSQPNLTKLTLGTAINWDWETFMSEADPALRKTLADQGFGSTATNAFAVLRACPNLKQLRVRWRFSSTPTDCEMDPEVFGDEFHENLVACCPLLERFTSDGSHYHRDEQMMIASLTDRSLDAFAKLPRLKFLEICAKNITGDAVFNLVVNPVMEPRWTRREYRILIGDTSSQAVATFYDVMLRLLQLLADVKDPSAFIVRPLSLRLVNNSAKTGGEAWYASYLVELKRLVAEIHATHPAVTIQIALVQEEDGVWGHQIASFGFHTPEGATPLWDQGSFDHRQGHYDDEPIDAVFVRRFHNEFVWDGGLDDDEDDPMEEDRTTRTTTTTTTTTAMDEEA